MATKVDVVAFIHGVKDTETRTILKTRTFGNIGYAIQNVIEYNTKSPQNSNAQIFTTINMGQQNSRGNFFNDRSHVRGNFNIYRRNENNMYRGNFCEKR